MGKRVKIEGDYWHGQVPAGAVYVGRAAPGLPASPYRNPFKGPEAAERFRVLYLSEPSRIEAAAEDIGGLDVACWCPIGADCHGDVLLGLIAAWTESYDEGGPA